jgi:uncharacterized protein YbaR (Trm112 family)
VARAPAAEGLPLCDKLGHPNARPSRALAKLQRERSAMAISEDLLEILACPACKAKVELKADGSGLKCVECHRVYPIREDIPVMLIDEATVEDEQPERN